MEEKKFPQTLLKQQINRDVLIYNNGWGHESRFMVMARIPERSYEDRSVVLRVDDNKPFSIKAEDAIELGMKIIEHGRTALLANMYEHQHIHLINQLYRFIRQDRVEKIILTVISETVPNYGEGWRLHTLKPVWKEGRAPEFEEDFEFETVIYWSPIEEEFQAQLEQWTVPVEIVGYDREKDVEEFNKLLHDFTESNTFDPRKRIRELREELESKGVTIEDTQEDDQGE